MYLNREEYLGLKVRLLYIYIYIYIGTLRPKYIIVRYMDHWGRSRTVDCKPAHSARSVKLPTFFRLDVRHQLCSRTLRSSSLKGCVKSRGWGLSVPGFGAFGGICAVKFRAFSPIQVARLMLIYSSVVLQSLVCILAVIPGPCDLP